MTERRIGVYICHCGGNISDYLDVKQVRDAVANEPGVVVAKTTMFACSDAGQQEMIDDIKEKKLDGLVVASCSPKLHLLTFRGVAKRAGLNPYQYVQVNIREQDSWAHREDWEGATEKAIELVRAGIAKARLSKPLKPLEVETVKKALIIGGGIAGLRAALVLADMGIYVYLIEREEKVGGWVSKFSIMYPHDKSGKEIIDELLSEIAKRGSKITIFTKAELLKKAGYLGNFEVTIKVGDKPGETIDLKVGSIIVATGFDTYEPKQGEFGYGMKGVVTLPKFKEMVEASDGELRYDGKQVKSVAYIYCVGSRQKPDVENANTYCSRYCCNATIHTSILVSKVDPTVHQFHLYRDIRTYGKYETLYEESQKLGSVFIKFDEDAPPVVDSPNGTLRVKVKDLLTNREEVEIYPDLVVLVTGMVPRQNADLTNALKIPIGRDRFYNEIHPKLRPVETVIDGVYIAGVAQGPKNSSESTASALAAASKAAALVMKGYTELQPTVAFVDPDKCEWCGACLEACPYEAIKKVKDEQRGKEVAEVTELLCKGCGGCVPVCPADAIQVKGYEDQTILAAIDALLEGE